MLVENLAMDAFLVSFHIWCTVSIRGGGMVSCLHGVVLLSIFHEALLVG